VAPIEEAIDLIWSTSPSAAKLTARIYRAEFATSEYGPDDVRRVRDVLTMSQALFARFLADLARLVGCIIGFPWEIPMWRG
jgi:hypothetical protein